MTDCRHGVGKIVCKLSYRALVNHAESGAPVPLRQEFIIYHEDAKCAIDLGATVGDDGYLILDTSESHPAWPDMGSQEASLLPGVCAYRYDYAPKGPRDALDWYRRHVQSTRARAQDAIRKALREDMAMDRIGETPRACRLLPYDDEVRVHYEKFLKEKGVLPPYHRTNP